MEDNIDSWPRSYFRNISEAIPYIETSDLIVRSKRGGPGDHWGVVLAGGLVLEGQAGLGSCLTGLSDFAPNERVTVIKPPHLYRGIINIRANKELLTGKPYDFLTNNCEHVARRVATGESTSGQIVVLTILGVASASLFLMSSRNQ